MMRQRQRAQARARGIGRARETAIPLPTAGLFVEAKTSEISGIYAGELTNWRSTGSSLRTRSLHSTPRDGARALQRIIFEYGASAGFITVFSDKAESGAVSVSRSFSGNIDTATISSHAVMVDANAAPVLFNGQAFSTATFTTSTGKIQNDFDGVIAHQDRLYFWEKGDDLDFYYGELGAITGQLTRFPLGRLGNITGSILCMKSLTVDAGHGMNDALAIFTTTGDIIAYEGLDPGDPRDWRLLSRIKAAAPVSKRAFVQVGADMWMLTASGVVSALQTLRDSSLALVNTISRTIQQDLIDQIAQGGDWSMHMTADATQVIINRVYEGVASQFIYRTESKSWFAADYPAREWHNLGGKTYFTDLNGRLATVEPERTMLTPITARWRSSWFRLPRSTEITYLQPTIIAKGPLIVSVSVLTDHDTTPRDQREADQTVQLWPDDLSTNGGDVALNDIIPVDAVGEVFQIEIEVTAAWAEIVNLKAAFK